MFTLLLFTIIKVRCSLCVKQKSMDWMVYGKHIWHNITAAFYNYIFKDFFNSMEKYSWPKFKNKKLNKKTMCKIYIDT